MTSTPNDVYAEIAERILEHARLARRKPVSEKRAYDLYRRARSPWRQHDGMPFVKGRSYEQVTCHGCPEFLGLIAKTDERPGGFFFHPDGLKPASEMRDVQLYPQKSPYIWVVERRRPGKATRWAGRDLFISMSAEMTVIRCPRCQGWNWLSPKPLLELMRSLDERVRTR